MKLLVRWLLLAAALLLVAHVSPGVTITGFGTALGAALVLGLLNTLVRPLLVLLTLPVTVLTLGLFLFVINALMFWRRPACCGASRSTTSSRRSSDR
jgi:putative membrane protein